MPTLLQKIDWVVAEVLKQLKESGVDDDTLVIFTADNGLAPYVKIPKMFAAGHKPSGDFRGAKASLYEGGHRVPFLVRWPAKVALGTTYDSTICTTDFFATFADILGTKETLPDSAAEDSFSFYSCLKGGTEPIRPFTIHHSIGGNFAIQKGPWKLLLSSKTGSAWGALPGQAAIKTPSKIVQLYNMGVDPGETKNLENSNPEKIAELVNDLAKALADGRTHPQHFKPTTVGPIATKRL